LFSIVVDQTHTVLLIEFTEQVLERDIVDLDRLLAPIAATNAIDKVVVDLRRVTAIDLPFAEVMRRATAEPALPGRKIVLVTEGGEILTISQEFAGQRASRGHGEIPVVPDLETAWRVLNIKTPMFF
jgi:hypothetical protein